MRQEHVRDVGNASKGCEVWVSSKPFGVSEVVESPFSYSDENAECESDGAEKKTVHDCKSMWIVKLDDDQEVEEPDLLPHLYSKASQGPAGAIGDSDLLSLFGCSSRP